jgi:hypothetical protein
MHLGQSFVVENSQSVLCTGIIAWIRKEESQMLSDKETLKLLRPLRKSMATYGKKTTDDEALAFATYLKSIDLSDFDPNQMAEVYHSSPPETQKYIRQTERAFLKLLHTCANCATDGREFKKCSVCKKTRYCSRECQKDDWKSHKSTCL